jgi:signal transduction histidine kinase
MAELLSGLLHLFQVARSDLRRDTIDFSALATEVAESLQESATGRTVHIEVQPGITVHADKGIIRLVIENLLGNALKFTEGQQETLIAVGVTANSEQEAFFVKDNGVGFDMQYVHKLFRPFERLHMDFPGTGIGLATVARCVRKHGGSIWAESQVGRGATFYFTLGEGLTTNT